MDILEKMDHEISKINFRRMNLLACTFFIAAYLTGTSFARTNKDWHEYKKKHNKTYSHQLVDLARQQLWKANCDIVDQHNAKSLASYTMGTNTLSDLGPVERAVRKGAVLKNKTRVANVQMPIKGPLLKAPPQFYDLRSVNCMPPVKTQGACGSCWAFSATALVEYYNCKKNSNVRTLYSVQQLVSCDTYDRGCDGGFYTNAWKYITKNNGQCMETSHPYTSGTVGIKSACFNCTKFGKVSSFKWVAQTATAIMTILATVGPVSVAMDANNNFMNYKSGVYSDSTCTTRINHAVAIVGYGETTDGVPYWIVRNSWGTSWGMSGYAFFKRGVNMCGIEDWPAYPVV